MRNPDAFIGRDGGNPAHGRSGRRSPGGHGARRGGRRARRDVRSAVLLVLAEEAMHGYQVMQIITDRSNGSWHPSPGAVYPVLAQLEDEGLVTLTTESGRKVAALTEAGRRAVEELTESQVDPFTTTAADHEGPDLRTSLHALAGAVREVGRNGSTAQRVEAEKVLDDARRALYRLLAETPESED